jgi:signal transduction histidine kinase
LPDPRLEVNSSLLVRSCEACPHSDLVHGSPAERMDHEKTNLAAETRCKLSLQAASAVPCPCDPVRIRQVLTHLLSNALKYGEAKPIELSIEARETCAHVAIRDYGMGISLEIAERIFERFGRAGPIAHYGGLGFGLYLARAVIEAHGGAIRFESKLNEGCTFMFDLPLSATKPVAAV